MTSRDDRMEQQQMRDEYHAMEERVAAAEDKCDRLREALQTCRAYARYPVSLDDCFMIFNEANIALQEVEG